MPRTIALLTAPWINTPLDDFARRASEWGYQALELACAGEHFEVQRALAEDEYCPKLLAQLEKEELQVPALNNPAIGQAVCGPVDARYAAILPDYVWGDGDPARVQARAAEEMQATIRAAMKLGANVVSGFTGAPIAAGWLDFPPTSKEVRASSLKEFARRWNPILDACKECGVRFAQELHAGQVAYDLYSAEAVLDALKGREEFGFALDPSQFLWQGADPVEFIRRFPERIYHVHMRDAAVTLNGRSSILGSQLPNGDPRRGWNYRSPGHGGVDWEAFIRALHEINYEGALSVAWEDAGMEPDYGAADACQFVKRLDFPAQRRLLAAPFEE